MMISLIGRLMTCSVVIVFIAAVIMAVKILLKRHLSLRVQYLLWFPLLFTLAVPFLPFQFHTYFLLPAWVSLLKSGAGDRAVGKLSAAAGRNENAADWLNDFSVSASRQAPEQFYRIVLLLWLAGAIFMTVITIHSCMKIRRLKQASLPLQNKRARQLFDACRQELHMKREIKVLSTVYLKSPVTTGFLSPCVIVPIRVINELTQRELRFILLHELLHCKHKDTLVNLFACLARILYWFHPIVWIAMRQVRMDGESACDGAVLAKLEEKDHLAYGDTLLKFAAGLSGIAYTPAAGMAGRVKELKKRILGIRDYRNETLLDRVNGNAVFILIAVLAFSLIPCILTNADTRSSYQIQAGYVNEIDLSSCFHGYEGSFVLYDTKEEQFSIYNRAAASKQVSPDSTYKIYSALAALQSGVIIPESTMQKWDQTTYPFEIWNQDHTLSSAMANSVNWYFNSLDRQSGLEVLKKTLSGISYGNQDLSGGLERFWMESSLKISPIEQVELLVRLNEETLPFDTENMRAVKKALFLSDSNGVSLYGKTGTGRVNDKDTNGWFIGVAESLQNTYVFAVNIQGKDGADGVMAGQIALDILKAEKIL